MDVFALDDHLLSQYAGFARSLTRIRAIEIQNKGQCALRGSTVLARAAHSIEPTLRGWRLDPGSRGAQGAGRKLRTNLPRSRPVQDDPDKSLKLRRHQEQAIGLAVELSLGST
jgi:hypothetical protein